MCVHCNLKTIFVFMTKQGMEEQRELQWSGVVKVPGFLAALCVVCTHWMHASHQPYNKFFV